MLGKRVPAMLLPCLCLLAALAGCAPGTSAVPTTSLYDKTELVRWVDTNQHHQHLPGPPCPRTLDLL